MPKKQTTREKRTKRARVLWQQPLLLREEIQANYDTRDAFLRSLPELEAAYTLCADDPRLEDIRISPETAKEALDFYNAVVIDGRHIELLRSDPAEAARRLGLSVKSEILDVLRQGTALRGAKSRVNEYTIVTAIVIIVADQSEGELVIDYSKRVELKA
jgi:hypothetical protein